MGLKPVAADVELLPPGCRAVPQEAQLLPEGCRPIPAGQFNFDGAMVEFFGGKDARDAINKAIIYQRFMAWIESNRLAGRNMRDGQAYSWNTYAQWAADIRIFHPKTIQKHVLTFEAMGLLSSQQPWKRDGDCTKHYTSPLRLSDNPEQMLLWSEHKTPRVGALDSDLLTTQYSSTHKPSTRNAKTTPATPRVRVNKPINAGAVAIFPNHIPDVEPVERKAEIPEQRPESQDIDSATAIDGTPTIPGVYPPPPVPLSPSPTGDEPTEEETQSSGATPEIDVPEWMPSFFSGCTGDELMHLLHQFGESVLLDAKHYAEKPANRIDNPPGYVRAQLAKGWRPPQSAGQGWQAQDDVFMPAEPRTILAPPPEPDTVECAIWKKVYSQLEIQLDRNNFDTYVRDVRFLRCEGGVYVIGAANSYARDMLQHRLYRDVRRILSNVAGAVIELQFEIYERVEVEDEDEILPLWKLMAERERAGA